MAKRNNSSLSSRPCRSLRPASIPVPSKPIAPLPCQYDNLGIITHIARQDSHFQGSDSKTLPSSRTAFWKQGKHFTAGRENIEVRNKRKPCIVFLVVPAFIVLSALIAATSLQGTIEKAIPQNLSLGTYRFCIVFIDTIYCKGLPLSLSDLPGSFRNVIEDSVNKLQPAATALTNIAYIRAFIIVGFVLLFIFVALFVTLTLGRVLCTVGILIGLGRWSKIIVHVVLRLICSVPLAVPAVILLLSWVKVDHGEVGGLCLGALGCAMVLTIMTAVSPALIHG